MTVERIDANPKSDFNYPYYLYVPEHVDPNEPVPMLVEPHNVAGPSDDFQDMLDTAQRRITQGFGRRVATDLGVPFLLAVFPRSIEEPAHWTTLTHSLDAETLALDEGPLERIDLQLLAMVDDARDRLGEEGYTIQNDFSLNGFSSAGMFVNRFTALHPDRVRSVSAGGVNGLALLPTATISTDRLRHPLDVSEFVGSDRLSLEYPVGVADLEDLTGDSFDETAYCEVNQFIYMGSADERDSLLYPDAWTDADLRIQAILTYGEDIHAERFPTCEQIYDEVGTSAVFRVYEGVGHKPGPALEDVVVFHKRSHADEDIGEIRSAIGGTSVE